MIANRANTGGTDEPFAYCRDLVKKYDYDAFLTSSAYPANLRARYFALRAFYAELAMIPDSTTQAVIAQMRLQFWRDAIKSLYEGNPPKQPIALAMQSAASSVPAYHLRRIVDARVSEVTSPGFPTVESLNSHAESTSSTLLYALLSLVSPSSTSTVYPHVASHLGLAHTIATHLRSLPYHASRRQLLLPAELTAKHGVVQEDVFRHGGDAHGIEDVVYEVASMAHDHIRTARGMLEPEGGKAPTEIWPVFASAIPTISYLNRLEQYNFNAFEPKLQTRDWKLPFSIWKANRSRLF
ncbi:hypothetical protein M408DRAFT_16309 [Serendipita vermifera MAFF 305830]|uniref:Squalene/phytoene synthase n=1 Tax=Serendipita vermifera MAFF 305830 TaxID=933852 RepID=A0A0C2XGU9_SERVB|nr:hypothetical protein M408DRAFT_16309 [Serendipita vermifera MAFF 305830]